MFWKNKHKQVCKGNNNIQIQVGSFVRSEKIKQSELTFKDLTENLAYIKVYWNDKLVYNDEEGEATTEEFHTFQERYNDKIVYEMNIRIVEWHHCVLEVIGE